MISELFSIGSFSISPFGVMMALAFFGGYAVLSRNLVKLGAGTDDDAGGILLAAGIGGIVGAKLYYAALHGDWHLLFDRAGLVWYGGFLGGAAAVIWTVRRRRLQVWSVADAAAPGLALGYAIGRIGCFLVGDDYGVPTDRPWGVAFPVGLPPSTAGYLRRDLGIDVPLSVPDDTLLRVHPTQLYETFGGLVIFGLGVWLLGRFGRKRPGVVIGAVLALLSVERFVVEFFRAKDDRFLGGFTLAQAFALGLFALGVGITVWRSRRKVA
jgi:phosphatidylglycerol:prolipoprotein diacylglycerol transferase